MVNAEEIINQNLLESPDENYFKSQRQAYINYDKLTMAGLMQHPYDDHGTISPMDNGESEQKMEQEWCLLDPITNLFEQMEEGVELSEVATTPKLVGKVVKIT